MKEIKNEIVDRASEFVQRHARYHNTLVHREQPYSVRYPLSASMAMFSADTWDLVERVARIMNREIARER